FPGAAERPLDIARQLYVQEPHFRETVLRCCQVLRERLKLDLQALFSSELEAADASQTALAGWLATNSDGIEEIKRAEMMQPIIFILEYALVRLLMEWKLRPQVMLGYGSGECVAACLAGVLSLEDALILVAHRAQLMARQDVPGSLNALLHAVRLQ